MGFTSPEKETATTEPKEIDDLKTKDYGIKKTIDLQKRLRVFKTLSKKTEGQPKALGAEDRPKKNLEPLMKKNLKAFHPSSS